MVISIKNTLALSGSAGHINIRLRAASNVRLKLDCSS